MQEIKMIYNGMWLLYQEAKLTFYDMKDGTLLNTLSLRQCGSSKINLVCCSKIDPIRHPDLIIF